MFQKTVGAENGSGKMIEELAKTAFESFYAGSDLGWKWEGELEKTKEHYRRMIRAVLGRMRKPTEEMKGAMLIALVRELEKEAEWLRQPEQQKNLTISGRILADHPLMPVVLLTCRSSNETDAAWKAGIDAVLQKDKS